MIRLKTPNLDFSRIFVTKRRKGRPDKERNTVRMDHCADAVEGV